MNKSLKIQIIIDYIAHCSGTPSVCTAMLLWEPVAILRFRPHNKTTVDAHLITTQFLQPIYSQTNTATCLYVRFDTNTHTQNILRIVAAITCCVQTTCGLYRATAAAATSCVPALSGCRLESNRIESFVSLIHHAHGTYTCNYNAYV